MAYLPPTDQPIVCDAWTLRESGSGICRSFEVYELDAQLTGGNAFIDALAITPQQADEILLASLIVVISAWLIRQAINVIIGRRY